MWSTSSFSFLSCPLLPEVVEIVRGPCMLGVMYVRGQIDLFSKLKKNMLFGFYGISTLVSYLTPNPFLCK